MPPDGGMNGFGGFGKNSEKNKTNQEKIVLSEEDMEDLEVFVPDVSAVTYTETGETASYTVPVGTTVTTALGTETNFSGLAEGNTIKIVLEKDDSGNDVVVGIWIVE